MCDVHVLLGFEVVAEIRPERRSSLSTPCQEGGGEISSPPTYGKKTSRAAPGPLPQAHQVLFAKRGEARKPQGTQQPIALPTRQQENRNRHLGVFLSSRTESPGKKLQCGGHNTISPHSPFSGSPFWMSGVLSLVFVRCI